jgi:hypothetical protein
MSRLLQPCRWTAAAAAQGCHTLTVGACAARADAAGPPGLSDRAAGRLPCQPRCLLDPSCLTAQCPGLGREMLEDRHRVLGCKHAAGAAQAGQPTLESRQRTHGAGPMRPCSTSG